MSDPGPPPTADPADAPPPPGSEPGSGADTTTSGKDPENSLAIISLVLGIVGIMSCQLASPFALFLGWKYTKSARERGYEPDPMGLIGMVLGAVGTALFLFLLLFFGGFCLLYVGFFVVYIALMVILGVAGAL